ncbi:MAG: 1-deoxy-D-xylulose-5-phosphate reductoisomerase [Planctomycetes bacterium]|nr:1-deoxy-D-xylulose-5-phosphate reductoisomerase [Planctomycetota bacterium]NOG55007.1 1-deoxy-D-xylulose-5-phosphate reductoisomerase [Planctomycetota bacterium]
MPQPPKRIIVLGSTGSIGTSALDVIEHLNAGGTVKYEIVGLACSSSIDTLSQQVQQHQVQHVAIADTDAASVFKSQYAVTDCTVRCGEQAVVDLIETVQADLVVAAMVGAAGLQAVVTAITRGCDIALANKETLVAGGACVMPLAEHHGVRVLPVDSEHSAVFQCLHACAPHALNESHGPCGHGMTSQVRQVVLTASGGPFRSWEKSRIEQAGVEEALNHPTWNMGRKITIDSASLFNKALELIEAHWLFGLPNDRLDAIVHPQSIVHSFVEFVDGSIIAQMGQPDMRTPIQYALTYPDRLPGNGSSRLDWATMSRLDFEAVDHDRFPALALARRVIDAGGTAGAVFNAANEVAVNAFLAGTIRFGSISRLVARALDEIEIQAATTLDAILERDRLTRATVQAWIDRG